MELVKPLRYIDAAHEGSKNDEAQIRSRLDQILSLVLGFAKREGQLATQNVSWGRETPFYKNAGFYKDVTTDCKLVKLSGRPDYALWYGAQADLETNLVIVVAEHHGLAESQLLAYMGKSPTPYTEIIADWVIGLFHAGRLERRKQDTTVYGISSDGSTFIFYRISEDSKWCKKPKIQGQSKAENMDIIGCLLSIFSETSAQSPMDSMIPQRQFSSSAGDEESMDRDDV